MTMTKTTLSLLGALGALGVLAVAAAGWYGWQYYASQHAAPTAAAQKTGSAAKPPAVNPDQLLADVLDLTGLQRQVAQLPEQVRAGFANNPGHDKMPPDIARALEKIVTESFTEENVQAQLVAQLKRKFDQKQLAALQTDFATPLARRMVALETQASTAEEQAAFFQSLANKPLSPARLETLQQLDRTTHASSLSVEIALSSLKAMTDGLVADRPAERAKLERELDKLRDTLAEGVRNNVLGYMAYTYRNASDADLAAYTKIYDSPEARWFSEIVMGVLAQSLNNASKRTGERLASLMQSRAPQAVRENAPHVEPPTEAPHGVQAGARPNAVAPAPRVQRKRDGNIGQCLALTDNRAIAKCAEAYR